ncbi:DUF2909 family protein [Thalassotalea maritima]|uniref:DUF2909 family protein n=1 Tax=Thalassotalea maritima TaxID=3242416 RepID=UPI0035292CB8
MIIKIVIVLLLLLMIYNLFKAGVSMNSNDSKKPPMSKYIGRRVLISALIILLLFIGIATGIIQPNPRPY